MSKSLVSLLVFVGVVGCGGQKPEVQTPKVDPYAPSQLFPLKVGHTWSYDVHTDNKLPTLAITRVISVKGGVFEVASGQDRLVYEVQEDGIFRPEKRLWLLKAPIKEGAKWSTTGGMVAEVMSVGTKAKTLAGDFEPCIEVKEYSEASKREIMTTFCSGVGVVRLESRMKLSPGAPPVRVFAELRGFDFGAEKP